MIVYLDLLFVFDFLICFIFLYVIEKIYHSHINFLRLIFGGIVGGLIVILCLFYNNLYDLLKIIGGIIICLVGLEKLSGFKNVVKISSFYTLNLASIGLVCAFGIINRTLIFLSIAAIILVFIIESNKNLIIFSNHFKYNIIVSFDKTSLRLVGYLDTGNFSEYENIPIIYIDDKYYPKELIYAKYKSVNIATVNSISILKAYEAKKCIIKMGREKKEVKALVIFCKLNKIDCLLNVKMFV